VTFSQQSWPNTCLGLGKPGEACGEVFIENGWRVVMSNGRQNWIYRTDSTGRTVRLESQENATTDGSRNERRNLPIRLLMRFYRTPLVSRIYRSLNYASSKLKSEIGLTAVWE
jgi:hypothetical protein